MGIFISISKETSNDADTDNAGGSLYGERCTHVLNAQLVIPYGAPFSLMGGPLICGIYAYTMDYNLCRQSFSWWCMELLSTLLAVYVEMSTCRNWYQAVVCRKSSAIRQFLCVRASTRRIDLIEFYNSSTVIVVTTVDCMPPSPLSPPPLVLFIQDIGPSIPRACHSARYIAFKLVSLRQSLIEVVCIVMWSTSTTQHPSNLHLLPAQGWLKSRRRVTWDVAVMTPVCISLGKFRIQTVCGCGDTSTFDSNIGQSFRSRFLWCHCKVIFGGACVSVCYYLCFLLLLDSLFSFPLSTSIPPIIKVSTPMTVACTCSVCSSRKNNVFFSDTMSWSVIICLLV